VYAWRNLTLPVLVSFMRLTTAFLGFCFVMFDRLDHPGASPVAIAKSWKGEEASEPRRQQQEHRREKSWLRVRA
jgi:hypothetical protein